MKAVILAAGRGVRMGRYTRDLPKGMLELAGRPLLAWQLDALREAGVDPIAIVTGYAREAIDFPGVRTFHNARFDRTNMIESLMCAREELRGDVLVSYADVLYTPALVEKLATHEEEVAVAVDSAWRDYWTLRYGTTEHDLETLSVEDGRIVELGREVESSAGIDHRYIGVLKFGGGVWPRVLELYEERRSRNAPWPASGKPFEQGYMTDLLGELIRVGVTVAPCVTARQWLEFDTERDYEIVREQRDKGTLSRYFASWSPGGP